MAELTVPPDTINPLTAVSQLRPALPSISLPRIQLEFQPSTVPFAVAYGLLGRLGVSRGFGAFPYKDARTFGSRLVTVEPELTTFQITPQTDYLILATDGVWDKVLS
jgi:hypothetical protein